ncbi:unnamed protein product [Prunus armeniaca]
MLFPVIDSVDLELLEKDVDMAEIKRSLFGIGVVTQAFQKCSIPNKLNYTLITLVPKVQSPQSMVQFRPISLCSTLHKVISKILVARLRPILPDLISPNKELMHKFKLSLLQKVTKTTRKKRRSKGKPSCFLKDDGSIKPPCNNTLDT